MTNVNRTTTTLVSGASEQEISDQLSSITNRVTVDELMRSGKKSVKTINEAQLKAWISDALRRVMTTSSSSAIDEATHQKLLDDARAELKRVMADHQKEAKQREAFQQAAGELQRQLAALHAKSEGAATDADRIRALMQERDLLNERLLKYEEELTDTSTELANLERILEETRGLFEKAEGDRQKLQKAMALAMSANGGLVEEALAYDRDWCGSRHAIEHEAAQDVAGAADADAEMDAFAESAPATTALAEVRESLERLHALLGEAVPGLSDTEELRGDIARVQVLAAKAAKPAAAAAPAAPTYPDVRPQLTAASADLTKAKSEIERLKADLARAQAAVPPAVVNKPPKVAKAPLPARRDGKGHVLIGVAEAARDATSESGSPAATHAGHGWFWEREGSAHAAFTDAQGAVWELMDLGQGWKSAPIGRQAVAAGGAGAPASAGVPHGYAPEDHEHVVYRGTDGRVHELCFTSGVWRHHDLSAASGAPTAATDPKGGYCHGRHAVAFRGADGNLHALVLGKDWRHRNLGPAGPGELSIGNDGVTITAADGSKQVVAL